MVHRFRRFRRWGGGRRGRFDRAISEHYLARVPIPFWVQVSHLASHVLGLIARRNQAPVKDVYLYALVPAPNTS